MLPLSPCLRALRSNADPAASARCGRQRGADRRRRRARCGLRRCTDVRAHARKGPPRAYRELAAPTLHARLAPAALAAAGLLWPTLETVSTGCRKRFRPGVENGLPQRRGNHLAQRRGNHLAQRRWNHLPQRRGNHWVAYASINSARRLLRPRRVFATRVVDLFIVHARQPALPASTNDGQSSPCSEQFRSPRKTMTSKNKHLGVFRRIAPAWVRALDLIH